MKTVDDDKLMSIAELVEVFGLTDNTWRSAIKDGTLRAARPGGRAGLIVQAADARAFARAFFEANTDATHDPMPGADALNPKEPT